jgi:hypothetical protein
MASADSCPVTRHVAMQGAAFRHRKRQAGQVSPDKNVNCRYTTAAFTTSPESLGLRHVVLTCPDDGLICCFCSSAHSFALRLPSDPSSRRRPCLRLVLLPRLTTVLDSNTGDLHPISSRPCRAYTLVWTRSRRKTCRTGHTHSRSLDKLKFLFWR